MWGMSPFPMHNLPNIPNIANPIPYSDYFPRTIAPTHCATTDGLEGFSSAWVIEPRLGLQRIQYANHLWRLWCGETYVCFLGLYVYIIRSNGPGKSIIDSTVQVITSPDFRLGNGTCQIRYEPCEFNIGTKLWASSFDAALANGRHLLRASILSNASVQDHLLQNHTLPQLLAPPELKTHSPTG